VFEDIEFTLNLGDLDDPAKTLALSYVPLEESGFGTLLVEVRASDLTYRAGFLTLEGDGLDAYLVAAAARTRPPHPEWQTLDGEMKLNAWGDSDGVELRLGLSPHQPRGYVSVETSMQVSAESLRELGAELRRLMAQPGAAGEPPPLQEAGVHVVTVEQASGLAEEAERLRWPVFVIDGPRTSIQFWRQVVATLPLDPPIMSRGGLVWDALSDSLAGGIGELEARQAMIWWKDSRHLARRDREAYAIVISVLRQVVETLGEPEYTLGNPTGVTVLVTA
jgi:Barstar (barnase inhibitor)